MSDFAGWEYFQKITYLGKKKQQGDREESLLDWRK